MLKVFKVSKSAKLKFSSAITGLADVFPLLSDVSECGWLNLQFIDYEVLKYLLSLAQTSKPKVTLEPEAAEEPLLP